MNRMTDIKTVCVYCGSGPGTNPQFVEAAQAFGKALAESGVGLVYGGGSVGLMGAVASATLENGGRVTGIIPDFLVKREHAMTDAQEMIVTHDMHERKRLMFERSDAFIVFPGGFGTMDEMFEILTWKQLQLHNKPIVIFNYEGYWDPLITLMKNIIEVGFAKPVNATYYHVVTELDEIMDVLGY